MGQEVDTDAITDLLNEAFEDHKLDRQEKYELLNAFAPLSSEQRAFVRNRAFDLVSKECEQGASARQINWLSKVIKALDSSRPAAPSCTTFFSPGKACKDALIYALEKTKQSVDVCVFTISDNDISEALIRTYSRGVQVRILTDNDKQHDLGSDIAHLRRSGIAVKTDRSPHHMHHKFAILDSRILITGSFNWTRSASVYNHENLMVIDDERSAQSFQSEFESLWTTFGENP